MAKGGARPGAGRPKGATSSEMRKLFIEFAERKENRELFFQQLAKKLKAGDSQILKWYGDQLLGKAKETVEVDGRMVMKNKSDQEINEMVAEEIAKIMSK